MFKFEITSDVESYMVLICGWLTNCVCLMLNLCYEKTSVPIQQQQILFNGNEVSNSQKLSALGVKNDDLLMMTVSGAGAGAAASRYIFSLMSSCTLDMHALLTILKLGFYAFLRKYEMVGLPCLLAVWLFVDVNFELT